jgi:hypothetical protein
MKGDFSGRLEHTTYTDLSGQGLSIWQIGRVQLIYRSLLRGVRLASMLRQDQNPHQKSHWS